MTVVPTSEELIPTSDFAVTLPRYAQIIRYAECQFFGVNSPETAGRDCERIWTKPERDMVARYLAEAQVEIEQVVNYPLTARWVTNEEHPYTWRVTASFGKVLAAGARGETDIVLAQAINTGTDPGVIGPVATTVTDESEIKIFHPGTDVEIHPSAITIAGGFVTIEVPRCRTVRETFADNPETGLVYADLNNFESTADIKRVFNDESTNAVLTWPHGDQCCATCAATTATACMSIIDAEIGAFDVLRATYSAATWSRSTCTLCRTKPTRAHLNYRAGLVQPINQQVADTVVRLAHSKMPMKPCACDIVADVWARDRNVPAQLTAARVNNPFGINEGAWIAWQFAQTFALRRGGVLV